MDEPGDNEFSSSIVFGFFDQAEETFASMDTALYVTPTTRRCAALSDNLCIFWHLALFPSRFLS
jgi:hypothetical protein